MKFKIDTKEKFCIITPEEPRLDAILAADLKELLLPENAKEGANWVLNLEKVGTLDEKALEAILAVYQTIYANGASCALTGLQPQVAQLFRQKGMQHSLNITPTLSEAIDIVMMEELERTLNGAFE